MGSIGVLQTAKNAVLPHSDITEVFNDLNLMQYSINNNLPLSYAIMAPYSIYTILHGFYCTIVVGGSYAVVIVLTVKTLSDLNKQRQHMTDKTYSLNKQIHYLLLIQVCSIGLET